MRCFFAIPLNEEIKDYIYTLMNQLKKDLKKYNLKIRFAPKKNLHITLMFLGDVNEVKLGEIKKIVENIKFKSFKFSTSNIGVFPNEEVIRVLWIGIKPDKCVLDLQKNIDESLLGVLNKKDNEFRTHITIARIGYSKQSYRLAPEIKKINVKEIKQEVNSFVLYKSELHKDGAKYFLIEEFKAKKK